MKCDHVLCPVQFLCCQKITDFKEQSICIKLLFQIGKFAVETFQMLTFTFREEAMRQTVLFACVCVCVCMWERGRERECVCVCVCVHMLLHMCHVLIKVTMTFGHESVCYLIFWKFFVYTLQSEQVSFINTGCSEWWGSMSFVNNFYNKLFVLVATFTLLCPHIFLWLALHKHHILKVTYVLFENFFLYSAGICVKCLVLYC